MRKWTDWEKRLHFQGAVLLVLAMIAVAMLAEVSKQNWGVGVRAYSTTSQQYIEQYARALLNGMTLEEKIGQLLFVQGEDALSGELGFGGVLLPQDLPAEYTQAELKEYIADLQAAAEIPLFVGVVEEGGAVNTISRHQAFRSLPFLSPGELLITGGIPLVETDTADKCTFLKEFGINVNFAPMCHVTTDPGGMLFSRSMGGDGADTARYVSAVVRGMVQQNMIGVLKHFPGYGNMTAEQFPIDDRSVEAITAADLPPFAEGLEAGAPVVLMGHTVVTAVDPQLPAALSAPMHQWLRRETGFAGVVAADIGHEALDVYGSDEEIAVLAVEAGNDLLVTDGGKLCRDALLQAVRQGRISQQRLDESVYHILKLKIEYGIISQ